MKKKYHHHTYICSIYDINDFKHHELGHIHILYPNTNGFYDLSTVNKLPDHVYDNYKIWADKKYLEEIFGRANNFTKHGCKNLIGISFKREDSEWQICIHHIVRKTVHIKFELTKLSLSEASSRVDPIQRHLYLTIPSEWIELSYTYTFPLYNNIDCPIGPNPLDTVCKPSLKIYSREVRTYYKYNFGGMFDVFYNDVEKYLFLDEDGIYKPGEGFDLDYDDLE